MMNKLYTIIFLLFSFSSLHAQVKANAGADLEICLYDTLFLTGSGLPSGDTGSYAWYRISDNQKVSGSWAYKAKLTTAKTENYQLVLTHTKNGVTTDYFDTISVVINALPSFQYNHSNAFCYSECPYNLTMNKFVVAKPGYNPNLSDSNVNYYKNRDKNWLTFNQSTGFVYNFCQYVTNGNVPTSGLRDTICFEYTDVKGCYNYACRSIRLNPNPVVETKEGSFCQSNGPIALENLIVKPFIRSGGISTFRCVGLPAGSTLDKNAIVKTLSTNPVTNILDVGSGDRSGDYQIEYCFKDALSGCQTCDTSTLTIVKLPELTFRAAPKLCINLKPFKLDTMVYDGNTHLNLPDAKWQCIEYSGSRDRNNPQIAYKLDHAVNGMYFDPSVGPGLYYLKVTDSSSGCSVSDSIVVLVNGLPIIGISLPDTVCSNDAPLLLNNRSPAGLVGTWSGTGVSNRYFNPAVSPRRYRYEYFKIKFEYTNAITLCSASDSGIITVRSQPEFRVHAVAVKANGQFYVTYTLSNFAFVDTSAHKLKWKFSDGSQADGWGPMVKEVSDSGVFKTYLEVDDGKCSAYDTLALSLDYKVHNSGVKQIENAGFTFYPNPAKDVLYINLRESGTLRLEDCTGKVILDIPCNSGSMELPMSGIQKGFYLITFISSDAQVFRFKLLKE